MTTSAHIDTHLDHAALQALYQHVQTTFADQLLASNLSHNEVTLCLLPQHLLATLKKLKDDRKTQFSMLIDITAVDWLSAALGQQPTYWPQHSRFEVVYHLLSVSKNLRIRIKVPVAPPVAEDAATPAIPSAISVYPAANWYEREVWDMFGIPFDGHPDLRRLLTDAEFVGHPLRKDFPLEGRVEVYYDAEQQRVATKPVDLPQDFRHFDAQSPWQGATGNAYLAETDNQFDAETFK